MKNSILLVPTAAKVPEELRLDLGNIPTGLIPLKGKPVLEHVSANYNVETKRYAAFLSKDHNRNSRRIPEDWNIISLEDTQSLAETILLSLENIPKAELRNSQLFINFADTLIEPESGNKDQIYFEKEDYTSRWTSFEEEDGEIKSITPKFSSPSKGKENVFTGVFKIQDPVEFKRVLEEEEQNEINQFYKALKKYLKDRDYSLIRSHDWQDVGHLDTYYDAKKSFLNSREFNEIEIDQENTIVKQSRDKGKIKPELDWYSKIPAEIQPYTPRIYSSKETSDKIKVKMEYIGYPSLADLFLFSNHNLHIWKNIYSKIFDILNRFTKYKPDEEIEKHLKEMYVDKTVRRLNNIENEELQRFKEKEEVLINGEKYQGIPFILENIEKILKDTEVLEADKISLMHGDLHFSNILYDPRSNQIKTIDPRGEFGEWDIYGDQIYDLAKIRHSISGKYDFIINDMFEASMSGNEVDYTVRTEERHGQKAKLFEEMLKNNYNKRYQKIKIVESLLFLSMVPLHSDHPERQKYMLAHGIKQFNETAINEREK